MRNRVALPVPAVVRVRTNAPPVYSSSVLNLHVFREVPKVQYFDFRADLRNAVFRHVPAVNRYCLFYDFHSIQFSVGGFCMGIQWLGLHTIVSCDPHAN